MARYDHLPIFVDAYKLRVEVEAQVHGFSNRHRAGLGVDLRALSQRFVALIIAANSRREERVVRLLDLRDAVEEFLVLLRVAKDVKVLASLKSYESLANLACSLSRQTEGWLRSSRAPRPDAGTDAQG